MEVRTGYWPRDHQAEIHRKLRRFSVLVCHRRFGKTVLCVNELIDKALRNTRREPAPRYAYIAPLLKQAKDVAWEYLKQYTRDIPGREVNESELWVRLQGGSRIRIYGADNPDTLRGPYLDGCVLDEYAQMSPYLWGEVIRPMLADYLGWAVFIGTPKGHNAFFTRYEAACADPEWYAAQFKASETKVLPAKELDSAKADMTEEEYEQEFECSFEAAIKGAYFGRLMAEAMGDGRIGRVPFDPSLEVVTAWDLGIGDPTAIWFAQLNGPAIQVIDYYENSGEGLEHYARLLDRKAEERRFKYATHYAPHDVLAKELGSGRTREETAKKLGIKFTVIDQHAIDDGINAARQILPRVWFDADKCAYGIECLRQYRAEFDDKLGTLKTRPLHDQYSHGADAFRYLAMGIKDRYLPPKPRWPETFDDHVAISARQFRERRGKDERI